MFFLSGSEVSNYTATLALSAALVSNLSFTPVLRRAWPVRHWPKMRQNIC